MSKKKTNKQVWQEWIDYYNGVYFYVFGENPDSTETVEDRFYSVVPSEYRKLMSALISCLKWHPLNKDSLVGEDSLNLLCGHCYSAKDPGYTCGDCALAAYLKHTCVGDGALFTKAEEEAGEEWEIGFYGPNCKKMYNACLAVYRQEYEKLFGPDWDN